MVLQTNLHSSPPAFSGILAQLKQDLTAIAKDLPQMPGETIAQLLGEKVPSNPRESESLLQRVILILFTASLLCEKSGIPLRGTLTDIKRIIEVLGAKHPLPFFAFALQVLTECHEEINFEVILQQFAPLVTSLCTNSDSIKQDLLGKLYQEFNSRHLAKPLNMNFTRWESGFLLAWCALSLPNPSWEVYLGKSHALPGNFTIIDPACGTGSLLFYSLHFFQEQIDMTNIGANFVRYIGLDVVPLAIHFATASWDFLTGNHGASLGDFHVMPLGEGHLGSLDLLDNSVQVKEVCNLEQNAQLVVMNPPFSRSSGSNTAFGTLSATEQQLLARRLKILRKQAVQGNMGAAGQAADFMLLADKLLQPGGRLAVVLPISCLFGAAWTPVRKLLSENYYIEVIFTHPESGQCNFSDKTHLSECMIIARKHASTSPDSPTLVVQIRHWPEEKLALLEIIDDVITRYNKQDCGEVLERDNFAIFPVDSGRLSHFQWSWGPLFRFSNPPLNTFISSIFTLQKFPLSSTGLSNLPLRELASLGTIAHDRAAYRAIKPSSSRQIRGNYDLHPFSNAHSIPIPESLPAFWGRQNVALTRWLVHPNVLLVKRPATTPDQFQRHSASRAQCLLPETLRFNTSSLFSLYCPEGVVSNVFWGFIPRSDLKTIDGFPLSTTEVSKIVTLWANTTFGLLQFLAIADETDENLLHWKKQTIAYTLLPDLETLSRNQVSQMCALFDRTASEEFSVTLQQRIRTQQNHPLDTAFLQIYINPENWERDKTEIMETLERLYQMGRNLLYFKNSALDNN
ncbi:MAG: hypothetical protein RBG13Loki_3766 [Promethearchaeota archaeon CR_4]|nr:MAG: hypothetical protein RBG13Loki_3766 [Candidatus Lokiarchaeota archaeon CR_4]